MRNFPIEGKKICHYLVTNLNLFKPVFNHGNIIAIQKITPPFSNISL